MHAAVQDETCFLRAYKRSFGARLQMSPARSKRLNFKLNPRAIETFLNATAYKFSQYMFFFFNRYLF